MELDQNALSKATTAFWNGPDDTGKSIVVAIEAYLAEMFKPMGPMIVGEAIPQRDYRKEAWIAALSVGGPAYADQVLADFDTTFPPEPTHG